jgi:pSer/pThr/pTyr-binding forkhead associated (FHA) protein
MGADDYFVRVKDGPRKGKKFQVKREALVFGSSEQADIILEAPGVDPRHAQIVFQGGQVILEDLGSQAGTFRNGQRLLGPLQVFPGDRIGLGPEVTIILEGQDPRDADPARGENHEVDPGLAPGGVEET